jgi:pimeloyl-ACP methyl ester carboxylesterase
MNVRKYGNPPYNTILVHGGPGAAGSLKPVCEELSKDYGIIEALQTKNTIKTQLEELKTILKENASLPAILVGHSWGAMLIFMFAANHPDLVSKIIMVSSGMLEVSYAQEIQINRQSKITPAQTKELEHLQKLLQDSNHQNKNTLFPRMGQIIEQVDTYKPIHLNYESELFNYEIFQSIWSEASLFRNSGAMLELGKSIKCDVVIIHGDYDSHPAQGIKSSIEKLNLNHRYYLLTKCGHTPWNEHFAKEAFFDILKSELS